MKSKSMTTSEELFKPLSQPWNPRGYQKKAVKFLLEHACAALFLDPGLGKTSITLAAIKILKKKKLVDKVLLVAPLRVCHLVWPLEREKWTDFHGLKIEILHGPDKAEALEREADVYIINPEGLDWLLQVKKTKTVKKVTLPDGTIGEANGKTKVDVDIRRWKKFGFDALCIDELSKFKNTDTVRFKAMKLVINTFKRRWGLTGSPAANGLLNLFGQAYILDEGRSLGKYITHYRSKYFNKVDRFIWVPQEGAEELIYKRLSPLALRMAAEDYIDMPVVVENNIVITLPPDVREFYDSLENDLIAAINDNVITASTAGVASGKCRQVANGGIYLTPELEITGFKLPKQKREWLNLHTEKVDALGDLIEELQGSPILVAYDFNHDLDRLREKFDFDIPYIGSGVTTKRAQELEKLWNSGKLPYLFGHPQSMAHGLNFQEAGNHVAWHSMTYDFELYDQFIRRVRRSGNKSKRIFVHHILAEDTVDFVQLRSLKSKNRGQQAFFKGLQDLAKSRK